MTFFVDAEITFWRDRGTYRAADVVARMYDRRTESFYTGTGETQLEAIAWCLHDYVSRALLGHDPSPARRVDARPGDGLVAAPSSRPRRITPAPTIVDSAIAVANNDAGDVGCFERRIPTTPSPRLFNEQPSAIPVRRGRVAKGAR